MAKIMRIEEGRKQRESDHEPGYCPHKYVTVYAATRLVSCATCGACLDPFDVLLDLTKGSLPGVPERDEERAMALEIVKRRNKTKKKEDSDEE
ncbi:MAG: hypothetical protein M0017_02845 [Desulfobacteraceae bacterium]|nr:hypothetical protein [Desulfobacteraceae bacterium]